MPDVIGIRIIEGVETSTYRTQGDIPSIVFEGDHIEALSQCLNIQKQLGTETPLFILYSLLGVKGYKMKVPRKFIFDEDVVPIDRENIILSEEIIEDINKKPEEILKPIFDEIWNAAGFKESWNYKDGKWQG